MSKKDFTFFDYEKEKIEASKWVPKKSKSAKGVVQILHGMAEYKDRYNDFAEYLNNEGYIVYANDHRGHGKTAENIKALGFFSDVNGWEKTVVDVHILNDIIKNENPGLPLFMFAHSMGSILASSFIQHYNSGLKALVLSGLPKNPESLGKIGMLISGIEMRIKGSRHISKIMDKMFFMGNNNEFRPIRTTFDWLCRDEAVVDKYIQDPFCGFIGTVSYYRDILGALININKDENIKKIDKALSIMFLSGEKDPVCGKKAVLRTYFNYIKNGVNNVKYKTYKNCRHELINELNNKEIYKDIVSFLNSKLEQ